MAHTTYAPLHKNWKTLFNERIDLYKEVSQNGDTAQAAFIVLRDRLAHEDHHLTLVQGGRARAIDEAIEPSEAVHHLHALAHNAIQKAVRMYHEVHDGMIKLKAAGEADPKRWAQYLHAQVIEKKNQNYDLWEGLRKDGLNAIADLPKHAQDAAAALLGAALGTAAGFVADGIQWVAGAAASVVTWVPKAAKKLVELGDTIAKGATNAWNAIRKFFGGGGNSNFAVRASEPADSVPTGSGASHPEGRNRVNPDGRHVDDRSHSDAGNRESSDGRHVDDRSHPDAGDGRHAGRVASG